MNSFPNILKELRTEKSLSQKELAEKLNYTQSNICEWEKGSVEPKATALKTIANYFNVSVGYLLGLEDEFGQKVAAPSNALTAEEKKLIEDYRALSPALKKMLQDTIQTWQRSEANKKLKA